MNIYRKLKDRCYDIPVLVLPFHGCRILECPFFIYFFQPPDGSLFIQSGIDFPKISGKILHVPIGDIFKGIAYYGTTQRWYSALGKVVAIVPLKHCRPILAERQNILDHGFETIQNAQLRFAAPYFHQLQG